MLLLLLASNQLLHHRQIQLPHCVDSTPATGSCCYASVTSWKSSAPAPSSQRSAICKSYIILLPCGPIKSHKCSRHAGNVSSRCLCIEDAPRHVCRIWRLRCSCTFWSNKSNLHHLQLYRRRRKVAKSQQSKRINKTGRQAVAHVAYGVTLTHSLIAGRSKTY